MTDPDFGWFEQLKEVITSATNSMLVAKPAALGLQCFIVSHHCSTITEVSIVATSQRLDCWLYCSSDQYLQTSFKASTVRFGFIF